MKTSKSITIALSIFLLILMVLPSPVSAAGPYSVVADEIKIGDNFILYEDQTYDGNLFILGGTATLEQNSTLNGDIVLLGANLLVDGTIYGDIVTLGGAVDISEQGRVTGDINSAGAFLDIDPAANIEGDINTETSGSFWTQLPAGVRIPNLDVSFNPYIEMLWFVFRTLMWALLAILTVMFLPKPVDRVANAVVSEPLLCGGLGLLTAIIAPVVLVILSITICLIPLTFTAFIALVIAWAFGLISLGLELGKRFEKVVNQSWHPAMAAGLGTFTLILVINGLDALIPCVGWIPKAIVGIFGLGSVLITFFGTRNYPISKEILSTDQPQLSEESPRSQDEDSTLNDQE